MPTKSVADEDMAIQLTGRLDSRLLTDRNKSIKTCLFLWGNLGSRKTAWWAWEDSNFQPNDYQLLASEVPEVAGLPV